MPLLSVNIIRLEGNRFSTAIGVQPGDAFNDPMRRDRDRRDLVNFREAQKG